MKNIWTQHLERSRNDDRNRENTFSRMLYSLVRTENEDYFQTARTETSGSGNKTDKNTPDKAETEIRTWVAESHKGYELGIDSLIKDSVRLIMIEDGRLFLRYDVAGETPFEMAVKSEDEAQYIIEEDNATTEQLYPDKPELKWIKIT
ncbi:hypothetical protein RE474_10320 [Methanolobus sediminis]|uniref:Uncharacterized protein n=1 Tax=Methanolobus sediminis TaxID=3072978 RepID=A0AA51YL17_9EURY|nr:hypothetical protein [Methanolobus sediminis]WMW24477.1 hypothetical protein RE474_10320 [Methanolobus sediminis]